MRRDVAEPVHAGGLRRGVRVEPARDGPLDDGLLLLGQQRDEPLLGLDEPVHLGALVVEVPRDLLLLLDWREHAKDLFEVLVPQAPHIRRDPVGPPPAVQTPADYADLKGTGHAAP